MGMIAAARLELVRHWHSIGRHRSTGRLTRMPEWKEMVMKTTAGRVLMALLLLVLAVWAFSYHSFEFKGGLGVSDTGFLSYPRYHAQLGELPSWKNGEYQFTVRGLPPGPLDLVLQVPNATD